MAPHSMPITTIQLDSKTRKRLAALKANPKQSYDELIRNLMSLIPEGDEEGRFTDEFRGRLLAAEVESQQGRAIPHAEAMRLLGLRP